MIHCFRSLDIEEVKTCIPGSFTVSETFKKREYAMIMLTKLNDQEIVLNCAQIESVEVIPESKVVMMNGKFFIVKESAEEIIQKTIEYNKKFHYYPTGR